MSTFRFVGGALKLGGARRAVFEIDTPALPKPAVVVEVPTVAPEVPTAAPEPVEVPTAAPEPVAVVEVPTAAPLEVEAPAEVAETAPEAGLVPENPPGQCTRCVGLAPMFTPP